MEHDRGGVLRAFAASRGIVVIAGDVTVCAGHVVVYDATGHPLRARWELARGVAYASCQCDPDGLAERLFAGG